jgi:hypothetical protein
MFERITVAEELLRQRERKAAANPPSTISGMTASVKIPQVYDELCV